MYYTGTGVSLDYHEAAHWVQRAAGSGYARAQLDLGYLYEQGKGVALDYVSAYAWYKLAAAAGSKPARVRLKDVSHRMTPTQLQQANARTVEFSASQQSVNLGDSDEIGTSFAEQK